MPEVIWLPQALRDVGRNSGSAAYCAALVDTSIFRHDS